MRMLLIFVCFLLLFISCKRGDRQVIELKNLSSETIYFLVSGNKTVSEVEIAQVRPVTSTQFDDIDVEYEDKEREESIRHNLFRYRIASDSSGILLSSESAGIFINSVTIQRIIKDRYDGRIFVFIISERDLLNHSNQEIVDEELFKHFKTLQAEDIKQDTLTLEYF